jgi:Na+/H+ antiporter NhaD/arsenite permease-like protein
LVFALATASGSFHHRSALLVILVLTYAGIGLGRVPGLKLDRTGIALLGAIAVIVIGRISPVDAFSSVNVPTLLLLFSFFVVSAQLRLSGLYDRVADALASRLGHPAKFLLVLMLATAGLAAVLNNDVVCLVFCPIVTPALLR